MADEQLLVRWVQDKNGKRFFPRTHIDAVKNDEGVPLSTLLTKCDKRLVTEEEIESLIATNTWVEGVTYYTVEDE